MHLYSSEVMVSLSYALDVPAGARHQTGWTGLVARRLDLFGRVDAKSQLETERGVLTARLMREKLGGEQSRP